MVTKEITQERLAFLFEEGLATTPENYDGNTVRLRMFNHLRAEGDAVKKGYRMDIPIPEVTALTHSLWERWLDNGRKIDTPTREALEELARERIAKSSTKQVGVRRAYWLEENDDPEGKSYNGLTTAKEVVDAIEKHYKSCYKKKWHKRENGSYEVALNLQEFTDPLDMTIDYETRTFTGTTPPIGLVATSRDRGSEIVIHAVLGDNAAANLGGNEADRYVVKMEYRGGKLPNPRIISKSPGRREVMRLDRGGKFIPIKLPREYWTGYIPIGEQDIIRTAILTAMSVARKGYTEERRIEASLGTDGFYYNQSTRFEPYVIEQEEKNLEPSYRIIAVINTLDDIEKLKKAKVDKEHAPAIVLPPSGISEDTTEIDIAFSQIIPIIDKLKEQDPEYWGKLRVMFQGTDGEHRVRALAEKAGMSAYPRAKLPRMEDGNIIIMERGYDNKSWLRVSERSGDGEHMIVLNHWPSRVIENKQIGNKANKLKTVLDRLSLPTPVSLVLTDAMFEKILKTNGQYSRVKRLASHNLTKDPTNILKKEFEAITKGLNKISDEDYNEIVRLLKVNIPEWKDTKFVARSTSPLEDRRNGRTFTGEFKSPLGLTLEENGEKPLREGILTVIKSLFTEDMAKSIALMENGARRDMLNELEMPVLIEPQVEATFSGTVYGVDTDPANPDRSVATVTIEPGVGGATGKLKERPRITVRIDKVTRDIKSAEIIYPTGATNEIGKNLKEKLEQFSDEWRAEINLDVIHELVTASSMITDHTGDPDDTEWALTKEGKIVYLQTRPYIPKED